MKISTRSRYGIRALVTIAMNAGKGPITLKTVAAMDCTSFTYLQKLATPLVSGGILNATRGVNGGVWLARPADSIKLSEVVRLLDGHVLPVDCLDDHSECQRLNYCATREVWLRLKEVVEDVLENTTIGDLAEKQIKNEMLRADMYNI